ncbi:MAG: HAD-IIA family hydrolase [Candidatus Bipolaricaulota bacterium]|nr:HAD-IIA family hydrolase [Candidatus Bipolaricaulota bacterium]
MIRGYLLDLDGTVYRGEELVPGADRAVATLRARGRKVLFLSNKPVASRGDYAAKLTRLGIPTAPEEVIHSAWVLAHTLARRAPGAAALVVGEPPLVEELRRAGLRVTEDPTEAQYVVAAFDRTLTYAKLNAAFQALRRGARFVATNPDRTCPVEGGEIPDAAGVIAFLEATAGRPVEEVFGKPSPHMVRAALGVLGLPPGECALVGDRPETDIRMAWEAGLVAILTLTGVTSPEEARASSFQPDHVVGSVAELPNLDQTLNGGAR